MSENYVLRCLALEKSYHQGQINVHVLRGITMDVVQGDSLAIVGASGSGKSTLLHLLGGLDDPSSGEVLVCGQSLSAMTEKSRGELRNNSMGFVYQFHHLLAEFTALENVAIPLLIGNTAVSVAREKAAAVLEQIGLAERMHHKPGEMSGGERQRAAIARALVTEPKCILADEPTGNLDEKTALQVFEVMMDLNRQSGVSLIMVTHNMALAQRFDSVKRLHEGKLEDA